MSAKRRGMAFPHHAPLPAPSGALRRSSVHGLAREEAPALVREALNTPGRPLDPGIRAFMEPRFGRDLSQVRVHADPLGARSAKAAGAAAYTVGQQMVFGEGQYAPGSAAGRHLLAHELAHTLQAEGRTTSEMPIRMGHPGASEELEADRAAEGAMAGKAPSILGRGASAEAGTAVLRRGINPLPGVIWDPKAAIITPGQIAYQDAMTKLKGIDATLHGLLANAPLNAGSKTIRTATGVDNSQNPPVTVQFTFDLDVKEATLPQGTDAEFDPGAPVFAGTGTTRTFKAPMVMKINSAASSTDLPQKLYHEGLHMLIYMDGVLPGSTGSTHPAGMANYKKLASGHKDYTTLLAELEVFIELDLTSRGLSTPGAAQKDAQDVWSRLLEEKYVFDQEKAKFGTPSTNRSIALTYLLEGFQRVGVRAKQSDKSFTSILDKSAAILDDVDRQVAAANAPAANPKPQVPSGKKP